MTVGDGTIQRAFGLASSGVYVSVGEIRVQLAREGYFFTNAHLEGPSIRKQLRLIIRQARKAL